MNFAILDTFREDFYQNFAKITFAKSYFFKYRERFFKVKKSKTVSYIYRYSLMHYYGKQCYFTKKSETMLANMFSFEIHYNSRQCLL